MFYIILVSSWTLMAVLYHTRVLLDLDGCSISLMGCSISISYILVSLDLDIILDGCSISYSCPLGP